jgi:hypothetical protein
MTDGTSDGGKHVTRTVSHHFCKQLSDGRGTQSRRYVSCRVVGGCVLSLLFVCNVSTVARFVDSRCGVVTWRGAVPLRPMSPSHRSHRPPALLSTCVYTRGKSISFCGRVLAVAPALSTVVRVACTCRWWQWCALCPRCHVSR